MCLIVSVVTSDTFIFEDLFGLTTTTENQSSPVPERASERVKKVLKSILKLFEVVYTLVCVFDLVTLYNI